MNTRTFSHVFDGFAKLHSFSFREDKTTIKFTSHFLKTISYSESIKQNNHFPSIYFGDVQPSLNAYEKVKALSNGVENTNVNVFQFGTDIVALSDCWEVYKFDKNLFSNSTRIYAKLPDTLPSIYYNAPMIMSLAHPLNEYGTGAVITLAIIDTFLPISRATINVIRAHALDNRELIASIPVDRGHYMHSFALTKNNVILFADPVYVNALSMLQHVTVAKAFETIPEQNTTVYIVSLRDGKVQSIEFHSSVFHAHHVNAFESDNEIHVDVVTQSSVDVLSKLEIDVMKHSAKRKQLSDIRPVLKRYIIDSERLTIYEKVDSTTNTMSNRLDFPVINEEFRFRKYCYIYGIINNASQDDFASMAIVKKDLCHGNDQIWQRQSHYPSEPTFVPNPNGNLEDDGVLLSIVLDGRRKMSYLLILDATTMKTLAVAFTPLLVPYTVHGRMFS